MTIQPSPKQPDIPRAFPAPSVPGQPGERPRGDFAAGAALRRQLSATHDDPGITTDLGEALSKLDGGADEARSLLESLAARDLVVSPEGYKALAALRLQKGDAAGQQLAMKRCESMAASAKVCAVDTHRARSLSSQSGHIENLTAEFAPPSKVPHWCTDTCR